MASPSTWSLVKQTHKHVTALDAGQDHRRAVALAGRELAAGVTFEVGDGTALQSLDMRMQADATMNTVEAWETRLALRRSPPVRAALHSWWSVVLKTIADRFVDGEVPYLDQEAYLRLAKLMYKAVDESASAAELEDAARADWESDSRELGGGGRRGMTRELFMDALFEVSALMCVDDGDCSDDCSV